MLPDLTQSSLLVAPQLLGLILRRTLEGTGEVLEGRIVEVEAYLGEIDRAAHSYRRHRSARNESMYGRAGLAYVYFTYGMHHCINIVCAHENTPQAVLLRALEPISGLEAMQKARKRSNRGPKRAQARWHDHELCAGPGRICQAMRINRVHDGVDLLDPCAPIRLIAPGAIDNLGKDGKLGQRIMVGPRIGIDTAGEPWRDRPLRFWLADCRSVSKSRAAGVIWRPKTTIPAWARQKQPAVVPAV
ncbi:MAG: DNA-3-methyladenine glycosylase [Phycisphaerales bacterium]|nr:DNA-3-methyladenine glycosylase [Phycisphaerales bacterium]